MPKYEPRTKDPNVQAVFAVLEQRGSSQSWLCRVLGKTTEEVTRIKHGYQRESEMTNAEFVERALAALELTLDELHARASKARKAA